MKHLTCIAFIITLLLSNAAFCAVKTKATLLADVDLIEMNSTKNYFGVSDDNRSVFYENYGERYTIFINGKELTKNDIIGWKYPWSADGKHTAIICIGEDAKNFAVIDGKEMKLNGRISDVTFSPDGKNIAYTFYNGEQSGISLDGKEAKLYDLISPPYFIKGKEGNRLVYTAKSGGKWILVIDGKERNKYDGIREVVVSPDGTRLAIEALNGGKGFVVVDGKEGKQYEDIEEDENSLVFSPDSKHIAYIAGKFENNFVVQDDTEHESHKYIAWDKPSLRFSPDSKHLAYVAVDYAVKAEISNIILDGKAVDKYGAVSTYAPVFGSDNKLAYLAKTEDGKIFAVFHGEKSSPYDGIDDIAISADGKHLAFRATKDEKNFIVLDGKEQKKYEQVAMLTLSADGKHCAYAAREGENYTELFAVIDGVECKEDGFIISDRSDRVKIIFDSPTKLHFIVQKDKKVYLVEKELE